MSDRKEAALARIEATARKREERKAAALADAEVASLEREAALVEALDAAEEKHGALGKKLLVVNATQPDGTVLGSVIVKVASPSDFSKFKNKLQNAKGIEFDHVQEALWRPCVVFPALADVDPPVSDELSPPDRARCRAGLSSPRSSMRAEEAMTRCSRTRRSSSGRWSSA